MSDSVMMEDWGPDGVRRVDLDQAPPRHGGDLSDWQRRTGESSLSWLDLSSACNREPWPIPIMNPDLWSELPDQAALMEQATLYYGVKPAAIGAGSQHIIESLPLLLSSREEFSIQAEKRVCVPRIGYQEHAFAWQKWGYDLCYYDSVDELFDMTWSVAVVIQPNNPTGEMADMTMLDRLVDKADRSAAYIVIDEAFIDPTLKQSYLHRLGHIVDSESLFILRSVGKFFGLPGARVGFVFCATRWHNALSNLLGPWPVSTASLWLIEQALKDMNWQEAALKSLGVRQAVFTDRIMPKLHTIFDSQQYIATPLFFTWFLEGGKASTQLMFEQLHQVGIHVRLGEGWIRVALPAMNEMDALNTALVSLLRKAGGRDLA